MPLPSHLLLTLDNGKWIDSEVIDKYLNYVRNKAKVSINYSKALQDEPYCYLSRLEDESIRILLMLIYRN